MNNAFKSIGGLVLMSRVALQADMDGPVYQIAIFYAVGFAAERISLFTVAFASVRTSARD
jgi:hypothetical protein